MTKTDISVRGDPPLSFLTTSPASSNNRVVLMVDPPASVDVLTQVFGELSLSLVVIDSETLIQSEDIVAEPVVVVICARGGSNRKEHLARMFSTIRFSRRRFRNAIRIVLFLAEEYELVYRSVKTLGCHVLIWNAAIGFTLGSMIRSLLAVAASDIRPTVVIPRQGYPQLVLPDGQSRRLKISGRLLKLLKALGSEDGFLTAAELAAILEIKQEQVKIYKSRLNKRFLTVAGVHGPNPKLVEALRGKGYRLAVKIKTT